MLYLPVSIGEALDKLSILQIKINKLQPDKKMYAENEYNLLYEHTKPYVEKHAILYDLLTKINKIIWNEMDLLRDNYESMTNIEYFELCKQCIEDNDRRFRIKNKINNIHSSNIKEQKSYKKNSLLLYLQSNDAEKIIQYFSTLYDVVTVILSSNTNSQLQKFFEYDNDIFFVENNSTDNISQIYKNYTEFIYDDQNANFLFGKKLSQYNINNYM